MKQQKKQKSSKVTIGLDLGDRRHRFCVLDTAGEVTEEGTVRNDRVSLGKLSRRYGGALAVLEKPITRARLEQVLKDAASRRQSAPKKSDTVPADSSPDLQS